ncbi:MAG: tRNA dihydrouridine synthase DusB, partial [Proteobacteria bacterium]
KYLETNPFVLAPMAAITDSCFRSFMRDLGAGVLTTELVSAHGIEYKSPRTALLMAFEEKQRPVGIQLFGETPEVLAEAAKVVEQTGADFVDLNFGCPVPKVVKKGAGSAILKDLPAVEAVFKAVKGATSLPVTVKIRTGWDETSRNAAKVAEIAYNEGLTWVAIHGRTRAAGYSGAADWDFISEVKSVSKIPIIGNGDVNSAETANRRLRESGCDGVMIGRGCLKNPWIFTEALELFHSKAAITSAAADSAREVESLRSHFGGSGAINAMAGSSNIAYEKDFVTLFQKLYEAFVKAADQRITMLQIKKFASWYSSGYPGASNFRKAIFQTQTLDEAMAMTLGFFKELRETSQVDTSGEAFLMGGHG